MKKVTKILITSNKTFYGKQLGVNHSVLTDGETIYSFENGYLVKEGNVVEYKINDYMERKVDFIVDEIKLTEPLNIEKYINMKGKMLCHEFIQHILNKEDHPDRFIHETNTNLIANMKESIIRFFKIVLYTLLIPIVFLVGYSSGCHTIEECDIKFNIESS